MAMLRGRDAEQGAIGALLARARDGASGALILRGEPGIGKTALLAEAVRGAGGMRVLRGAGVESETELPFAGLHLLLGPGLSRLGALPPPQRAALSCAFGLGGAGGGDRFMIGAGVLSLLAEVAEEARCCASSTTRTGSTARPPRRCCSPRGGWTAKTSRSCSWCGTTRTHSPGPACPSCTCPSCTCPSCTCPGSTRTARPHCSAKTCRRRCGRSSSPRPAGIPSRCWNCRRSSRRMGRDPDRCR
ncbi:ATP-binding protein [Amycolatopsis acidiphila]|uniref:ATP-binding protein n=1 Tax=Amycolatopsis acidiphila TaxID=715473 RepID=A0A558AGG5_9PSEU|nr:ATP-binding protein [Amycolatopsis acidiphila]